MIVDEVKWKQCNFEACLCGSLYTTFKTSFQPYAFYNKWLQMLFKDQRVPLRIQVSQPRFQNHTLLIRNTTAWVWWFFTLGHNTPRFSLTRVSLYTKYMKLYPKALPKGYKPYPNVRNIISELKLYFRFLLNSNVQRKQCLHSISQTQCFLRG